MGFASRTEFLSVTDSVFTSFNGAMSGADTGLLGKPYVAGDVAGCCEEAVIGDGDVMAAAIGESDGAGAEGSGAVIAAAIGEIGAGAGAGS